MTLACVLQTIFLCLSAVKPSREKERPANAFSETHAWYASWNILGGTITHSHTHASTRWTWHINFTGRVRAFKVEPHRAVAPVYSSGGAAAEGHCPPHPHPHHPPPRYKSYLTVSMINPHMLMQQWSSQAKWQTDQCYKLWLISNCNGLHSHNVCH